MFQAIYLLQTEGKTHAEVRAVDDSELPDADTTVRVEFSSINYKDALAITGRSPVVRKFPMVPGIDCAGVVESTHSTGLAAGDRVVLTGWGHGETTWGGLAGRLRTPADRLVKLPEGLDTRGAMQIGTAGFTAMLAVEAICQHVKPGDGEVLVTGANGGVGGYAVALLARRGYKTVAATGREQETERLRRLGANEVIPRAGLAAPGKPLQKERWAAVVDSVGSNTLANACASTRYGGVVAACGLAQGMDFPATVAPFILRAVRLIGIDSVYVPIEQRQKTWAALAAEVDNALLEEMSNEIKLSEVIPSAANLLDGQIRGRLLVKME